MPTLSVSLNDVRVGWLEALEDYYYYFMFDTGWLANPQRPVLGQLFEDRRPQGIYTSGLPCWFAHLLPQGPLRRLIARAAEIDASEDFQVLAACGGDLPGAVVLAETETQFARKTTYLASQLTSGFRMGFSLAGNQWKLSVRQGERGLVIPAVGENAEWVAKFPDPAYNGLPRVEHATMLLAKICGLRTPEVRLVTVDEFEHLPEQLPVGDGNVFLSRRFDRVGAHRVHMEDMAQVLDRPPGDAIFAGRYEEIARLLWYLSRESIDDFIKQLVFCVVVGNGDAHLKNWSLLYADGRTPRLSPAYDLIPTIVFSRHEDLALSLGGTRQFEELNPERFATMARAIERSSDEVGTQVRGLVAQYAELCLANLEAVGFDERERERLTSHMTSIARQFA
jgi:serine/threonine-protein kinase HipA